MTNEKHKQRQPIRFERLSLQAEILEPSSRRFLNEIRDYFNKHNQKTKKILDLGCATGDEASLLREYFPEAEIVAVDSMPEYVDYAQKKFGAKNINFLQMPLNSPHDILNKIEPPDLIYCRMFLMHFKNPDKYLSELRTCLTEKTFFAIEEPDLSKTNAFPESTAFKKFVDLLLQYGNYREEDYLIGATLQELLKGSNFDNLHSSMCQPKLRSEHDKMLIHYLLNDLTFIFTTIGLNTKENLETIKNETIKQLHTNKIEYINYYSLTQILASI